MKPRSRSASMLLLAASSAGASPPTYQTVWLTKQQAPTLEPGVIFNLLTGGPVLSDTGRTAFLGRLSGSGITDANDRGYWGTSPIHGIAPIFREGQQTPGLPSGVLFGDPYSSFFQNINAAGDATFVVHLTGDGVTDDNDVAMWSESGPTGLHLVAREGDQAPGTPAGVRLDELSFTFVQNMSGQILFRSTLTGPGVDESNDTALWLQDADGGTTLLARAGQTAPGTAMPFSFIQYPRALNDDGTLVFRALVHDESFLTTQSGDGLWFGSGPGNLTPIALIGWSAPGIPGATYAQFTSEPGINATGNVAFVARIEGDEIDASNDEALFLYGNRGRVSLLAREGDTPPGMNAAVHFADWPGPDISDVFFDPILDDAGYVTFFGQFAGGDVVFENSNALWHTDTTSGSTTMIMRRGTTAPGTNAQFAHAPLYAAGNSLGQVAFTAQLTGSGVDATNDLGLWLTDLDGDLHLIAREGDAFDVDDREGFEDIRTVSAIVASTNSGGADGRETSLNEHGELAFRLSFTNSTSGIFKAKFGDFPCPVDLDANGTLNFDDINAFIVGFLDGDSTADLTGDGALNLDDIDVFVRLFLAGCP